MFSSIILITCGISVDIIEDSTHDLDMVGSAANEGQSVSTNLL